MGTEVAPAQAFLGLWGEVEIKDGGFSGIGGDAVDAEEAMVREPGAPDPEPFEPRLAGARSVVAADVLEGEHASLVAGPFAGGPVAQPVEKGIGQNHAAAETDHAGRVAGGRAGARDMRERKGCRGSWGACGGGWR